MHHAIEACFLQNFWQRESAFHYCKSQTSLSDGRLWLSCDHTFKSVCNIGSVRQADRHWIKQYTGLLCVLKADGQVLMWTMATSLTFENIEEKLLALHWRLTLHGKRCWVICWYIFHAVQRISKQIPKRHPTTRNVWDRLETQLIKDPQELKSHLLHTFSATITPMWNSLGRNFLQWPSNFITCSENEIFCLLVHIDKGCLSGILPGRGTNRNEDYIGSKLSHHQLQLWSTISLCIVDIYII